jgi:uncharacterized protein (DUF433 family)
MNKMNLEEIKLEINKLEREDVAEIIDFATELYDALEE